MRPHKLKLLVSTIRSKFWTCSVGMIGAITMSAAGTFCCADGGLEENPLMFDRQKACGPMCLTFIDKLSGGNSEYRDIITLCPPGAQGVSLLEIGNAARRLGYRATGLEYDLEDLKRLRQPSILHLQQESGKPSHFVVLVRWNQLSEKFEVFDPPGVLVDLTPRQLSNRYSGVCMIISKTSTHSAQSTTTSNINFPGVATAFLFTATNCFLFLVVLRRARTDSNISGGAAKVPSAQS